MKNINKFPTKCSRCSVIVCEDEDTKGQAHEINTYIGIDGLILCGRCSVMNWNLCCNLMEYFMKDAPNAKCFSDDDFKKIMDLKNKGSHE